MPNRSSTGRVRVKFCGMTRTADALHAAAAGADAIGLVFHPQSPRAIGIDQAAALVRELPPFLTVVGLFVDPDAELVRSVLSRVPLDCLQFHGEEEPEFCAAHGRPYIKALRMRSDASIAVLARRYTGAQALLLDSYVDGVPGGTGRTFDWSLVPSELPRPLILAGGLTPDNVGPAIAAVRPYAVDVSGGIEQSRGIKDPEKMTAFMRSVASV